MGKARAESQSMYDVHGWEKISCDEADGLRADEGLTVYSSFTDLCGEHGSPLVFTEWGVAGEVDLPVLRDWRFPAWPPGYPAHDAPDPSRPVEAFGWGC